MQERVLKIVLDVCVEMNSAYDADIDVARGAEAPLSGEAGVLESVELVSLIIAVEEAVEEEFGMAVALADDRAFSRSSSPFRTVGSLADYILEILGERD
ncbi:MAG: acyl carrier protein [Actinomycetota bacterium]